MGRPLLRAGRSRGRARAAGERLMFVRFAELAHGHRVAVVVASVLFFAVAGALGAGVADRLDPYGDDDPASESVRATEHLEAAGYRGTDVIVLIEGADPTTEAGAKRVAAVEDDVRALDTVESTSGYAETRSD